MGATQKLPTPQRAQTPPHNPPDPFGSFLPVCSLFLTRLNGGLIGGFANYGEITH